MKRLVLFCILCTITPVFAQEPAKTEFVPLPIIAYSPESALQLGVLGMVLFVPEGEADAPKDMLVGNAIYSLKNQYQVYAEYEKNFDNGRFKNTGSVGYSVFPTTYYGVGCDTPESNQEHYTPVEFVAEQALVYRFMKSVGIGPTYYFNYFKVSDKEDNKLLDRETPVGGDGALISQPGIRLIYDARNCSFYPSSGDFFMAEAAASTWVTGSSDDCASFSADYRRFFNLYNHEYIIGIQLYTALQTGDVPLPLLESVGGSDHLRGYYASRYMDKNKYAAQTELRYPLPFVGAVSWLSPLSGAVFGGVADVAASYDGFEADTIRWAAGAGLRYAVMKKEKVNVRLDLTVNREGSPAFYLDFMEAF
ncbi:MAG: BamA/TamA family outer membrane protein [Spirochaetota bacterium]